MLSGFKRKKMNIEKDFGKKMREACIETSMKIKELGKLLATLNKTDKVNRSKYHS